MASECLFCKIISGEIPSTQVYRDERVMAFLDITPVAPEHVLVVPLEHLTFLDLVDHSLIGYMALAGDRIASERGIRESGFRLTMNQGEDSGQEIDHLHLHITGGHPLGPIA